MVSDELERMNNALAKVEGGKIKAITDGDRVYLMIQDAPEELRRLADALEKLNVNEIKALVAYANPTRREAQASQRVKSIDAAAAPKRGDKPST
jgi:hypothetical protein